ncbi:MAG: hypothetical protein ABEN55_08730 [Bradymonadaceae bacterium]
MQKITRKACKAFLEGTSYTNDNTEVRIDTDTAGMYLHGNLIARHRLDNHNIRIRHAGYRTHTTKNRLRGISKVLRIDHDIDAPMVRQEGGVWYLGDTEFDELAGTGGWVTLLKPNAVDALK